MMRMEQLSIYPVKSLSGGNAERAQVEPWGLRGDRRWMVVDHEGRFQTIRNIPAMLAISAENAAGGIVLMARDDGWRVEVPPPDPQSRRADVVVWDDVVPALLHEGEGAARLSTALGRSVLLAYLDDPLARGVDPDFGRAADRVSFADAFPLLLTTTASLADLSRRIGADLDMRRFRPNVVVGGSEPWEEDSWRRLRIGRTTFRVVKACARCAIPTRDPDTGAMLDAGEPLRTLGAFHRRTDGGIAFGQNLIPDTVGEIAVGDDVEILERGPSNLG